MKDRAAQEDKIKAKRKAYVKRDEWSDHCYVVVKGNKIVKLSDKDERLRKPYLAK